MSDDDAADSFAVMERLKTEKLNDVMSVLRTGLSGLWRSLAPFRSSLCSVASQWGIR